eukprot:EG_transcript_27331
MSDVALICYEPRPFCPASGSVCLLALTAHVRRRLGRAAAQRAGGGSVSLRKLPLPSLGSPVTTRSVPAKERSGLCYVPLPSALLTATCCPPCSLLNSLNSLFSSLCLRCLSVCIE